LDTKKERKKNQGKTIASRSFNCLVSFPENTKDFSDSPKQLKFTPHRHRVLPQPTHCFGLGNNWMFWDYKI